MFNFDKVIVPKIGKDHDLKDIDFNKFKTNGQFNSPSEYVKWFNLQTIGYSVETRNKILTILNDLKMLPFDINDINNPINRLVQVQPMTESDNNLFYLKYHC